mgnify:CR=1 FL=1
MRSLTWLRILTAGALLACLPLGQMVAAERSIAAMTKAADAFLASLTPEQRRQARNNYRLARSLPKDQRVATWEQYQQMTPEQQAVLRQSGMLSNTAARHAEAFTGLAVRAARPLSPRAPAEPRKGSNQGTAGAGKPVVSNRQ